MKFRLLAALCFCLALALPTQAGVFDWMRGKTLEERLVEKLNTDLNVNRQAVFSEFHPVGTATRVEIHEVQIAWRNNQRSNDLKNAMGYVVRYTIYWKGPVTNDGFTKVVSAFDLESKRFVRSEILATNGVTNRQAGNAALDFLDGFLNGAR